MSYTQLCYHIVWRTYCSEPSVPEIQKPHLLKFLYLLCKKRSWHLIRINAHLDHLHLLVELPPTIALSEAVKIMKSESSQVFKHHPAFPLFKGWNRGYGAFTVGFCGKEEVRKYIMNQSEHHKFEDTRCELMRMLSERQLIDDGYFEQNW